MAGAFAFVFGLCALSFAGGCVVTAIMLRRADPAAEVVTATPEAVEPAPPATRENRPDLTWPPDDFAAKPIHRNPVVGLPSAAEVDEASANSAPAALALAPDPTFTGMFETPPAPWLTLAPEPVREPLAEREEDAADDVVEAEAVVEPETMFVSRSGLVTEAAAPTDPAAEAEVDPVVEIPEVELAPAVDASVGTRSVRSLEVDLAVVASIVPDSGPEPEAFDSDRAREADRVVADSPEPEPHPEADAPTQPAAEATAVETASTSEAAPAEPVESRPAVAELAVTIFEATPAEPVAVESRPAVVELASETSEAAPAEPAVVASAEATSEVAPEAPAGPATPEPQPAPALDVTPAVVAASEPEAPAKPVAEEPQPAPAAGPVGDPETVVLPAQMISPEPTTVVAKQQLQTPDSEFRQRYLRTFEAARRRSNH